MNIAVIKNTKITDHKNNWAHLQHEEGYYIKAMSPESEC